MNIIRKLLFLISTVWTVNVCSVFAQQWRPVEDGRGFVPAAVDSPSVARPAFPRSAAPNPVPDSSPQNHPGGEEVFTEMKEEPSVTSHPPAPPVGSRDPRLGERVAKVSKMTGSLPQEEGQFGRDYDITPYTTRTGAAVKPEQVIFNWILRQTGQEVWNRPPFGFLWGNHEKLSVYHTPEMQLFAAEIVDRFVNSQTAKEVYAIRMVSLGTPTWRTSAVNQYLKPIPVKTAGVQGWLLSRENYGKLASLLARRSDFRDHISSNTLLMNGQPTIIPFRSPRNYIRDVQIRPDMPGGYVTDPTVIEEGYYLEGIPLMSLDRQTVDIMLKLEFLQVEKMIPMIMDVPTASAPGRKITIEKPQTAMFRLDEQIRWPKDKVLMLDLGMIPMPAASQAAVQEGIINKLTVQSSSRRSNVILFIDSRGPVETLPVPAPPT
ncbi:MAG: hypothetical protein LBQ54_12645 [Planctomycetaceae bacterium]|nr:hypothetical protein [Planctomycetaceae bacterium]